MKRLLLMIAPVLLLTACRGNSKSSEENNTDTATVKSMAAPVDEKTQKMEALKKLSPLTLEQMRTLLPHELNGVKEKNYTATAQFGYGLASIEYPKNSSTGVKVTLYDCAGDAGSALYVANYWGYLDKQQEGENEYTKTVDFKGGKAVESYKKDLNLSTLTYVVRDRLLVVVEGKNMKPEELREAAEILYANMS